ncbi:MAG: electron transfer flavoprotein subunit beta/FixA family protein [Chloroflexi bacterium]|nr:MAG: electron transfer flavoprotein subunit beta/FixA family protein [Chloroflexota bacterium]
MKLLVPLKQVPDSTMRIKVAPDGKSIVTEGITWSISPYDEYAVEMALEQKDADPSTTVSVVTVGPVRAKDALRAALAMGCDDGTFVTSDENAAPLVVARALAKFVEQKQPDLVLCGRQASDDDQGFVGPALATILGWPHVATVTKFAPADGGIEIWREVEGGHEVWKASGPALVTVQKSDKEPRYASLPGIMKAKKKELPELALSSLGVDAAAPKIEVVKMETPPQRGGGKILKAADGDAASVAAELVRLLRDEAKVL